MATDDMVMQLMAKGLSQDTAEKLANRWNAPQAAPPPPETTQLTPVEESTFQSWAKKSGIRDVDHPDSHYDYRGAWKAGMKAGPDAHWPDTFKQHGHPTFSVESQYSAGPGDGGHWGENGEYIPQAKPQYQPTGNIPSGDASPVPTVPARAKNETYDLQKLFGNSTGMQIPSGDAGPVPTTAIPPPVDPSRLVRQGQAQQARQQPQQGSTGGGGGAPQNPMLKAFDLYGALKQQGLNDQEQLVRQQGQAAIKRADEEAEAVRKGNSEQSALLDQYQAHHAERQAKAKSELDALNAQGDALKNYKEDPQRLWHTASDGQKAAGIAALLIGSIGAGMSGKENLAQRAMTEAMDRDTAKQRAEYQANRDSYQAKSSAFGRMVAMFGNEDSAELGLRALKLDGMQRELQGIAATANSEQVRANAQQAMLQVQQQRQDTAMQFAQQRYLLTHPQGSGQASGLAKTMVNTYGSIANAAQAEQQFNERWAREHPNDPVPPPGAFVSYTHNVGAGKIDGSGGGGGGGARLGMAAERAGLGARALDELEKAYDSGADRGYLGGKLEAIGNAIGSAFGTTGSALREATKKGATAETAAALAGGSPTDTMLHEIGTALDTNDPNRIKAVIGHYRGMLKEAERRYVTRAGKGSHANDAAEFEAEAK